MPPSFFLIGLFSPMLTPGILRGPTQRVLSAGPLQRLRYKLRKVDRNRAKGSTLLSWLTILLRWHACAPGFRTGPRRCMD